MQDAEYKSGYATVLGTRFEVRFSPEAYEYSEGTTQKRLNELAREEILCKLNEIEEVQNDNALATIHHT